MTEEERMLNEVLLQGGGSFEDQLERSRRLANMAAQQTVKPVDTAELARVGQEREALGLRQQGMGLAGAFGPEQMQPLARQAFAAGLEKEGPAEMGEGIYSQGRVVSDPYKASTRLTRALAAQSGAGREFAETQAAEAARRARQQVETAREARAERDSQAGRWIKMKEPDDTEYLYNPLTGERRSPGIISPSTVPGKMTEGQASALNYGTRIAHSNRILDELGDDYSVAGLAAAQAVSDIPVVGGVAGAITNKLLVSKKAQQIENAQRNFISAALRKESGATITPSEYEGARRQYFPMPGDSQVVIDQKRELRKLVERNFAMMAGPAAARMAAPAGGAPRGSGSGAPGLSTRNFEAEYGITP